MPGEKRFAVLIDADNVANKYIKHILEEITNDGEATYKRIYGDWTNPALASWKAVLLENSVTPIQQYSYTHGKNATDSAMIIDAMDILYTGNVQGFCIVSSDSDFTRLASRLREAGMYVVGMGEKKTPLPFIAACNKFTYLEVISRKDEEDAESKKNGSTEELRRRIQDIVEEISDEEGWAQLGSLGTVLIKRSPDFDVRNYGFLKLTPLIKSLGIFDIKSTPNKDGTGKLLYIRKKPAVSTVSEKKPTTAPARAKSRKAKAPVRKKQQ